MFTSNYSSLAILALAQRPKADTAVLIFTNCELIHNLSRLREQWLHIDLGIHLLMRPSHSWIWHVFCKGRSWWYPRFLKNYCSFFWCWSHTSYICMYVIIYISSPLHPKISPQSSQILRGICPRAPIGHRQDHRRRTKTWRCWGGSTCLTDEWSPMWSQRPKGDEAHFNNDPLSDSFFEKDPLPDFTHQKMTFVSSVN